MKKMVLIIAMIFTFSQISLAETSSSQMIGVRRSIATVIFAGLGGAVLGLSTLSFYGQPQDHVGNIWMGLGVGLIAGTGYVATRSAADSAEFQIPTNPNQLRGSNRAPQLFVYSFDF